ncbi:coiled-coil domain-containing protein 96 [Perca fluviatilis]|uniref:coiled-coil domain-containing protein 96 n=1 Tax=Perca fluviatilis TaxID=8168 RepID=UPI0019661106|nr:coiled-coil domain-containing protein 96 [Perca fluviatilis]
MDGETGNEVKNVRVASAADSTSEEDNCAVTGHGSEKEDVKAETVASDHDEEDSESVNNPTKEAAVEEAAAATSEPEENTSEDLDVKTNEVSEQPNEVSEQPNEVSEQPTSHEESAAVSQVNSSDGDGPPSLHPETPQRKKNTSPTQAEEEGSTAAPADKEDSNYEDIHQPRQEQREDRDVPRPSQRHRLLQMKLAEFFQKKAGDEPQLDREVPVSEQEYEKYVDLLAELKQQLAADSESAQRQAEELRFKSQQRLDKVENEWRALVALKQDVAVTVLSRRLGKQASQAKVEATLATEKLLQHELIMLRRKHIKLQIKIRRLEAQLREGDQRARDPLQLQFEQLQAERLELKKHTKKQNEESSKMHKKISSSLELLSNVKEKLFWSQMEVQAKREQLAVVEATVARKRDLLTRTRQARNGLQRDNVRLKEHRGLLGNSVLLRDFEDTVDVSDQLEEQLEDLKCRRAEMVFSCGTWRK